MKSKRTVKALGGGIYMGAGSKSIIQTTRKHVEPDAVNDNSSGDHWSIWGDDNDYPQKVIDANMPETTSAGALRFKRNAHYGAGIQFYYVEKDSKKRTIVEVDEEDLPEEVQEFVFMNDIPNLQQGLIADFEWWNQCPVLYTKNIASNKILQVDWRRMKNLRAEKKKNGRINKYYLSGKWPDYDADKPKPIQVLDKTYPFKHATSIYVHKLASVDRDYYPTPEWHSSMSWIELTQKIPKWIFKNIDNSINIKYWIQVPEKYFHSLCPRDRYDSDEAWDKAILQAEEDLYEDIDENLAGEENVSKTFYTKYAVDIDGNALPGWKIDTIKNELQDTAWLNAYGTGAAAICTGHGVPPSLQGLILSNGLGTGSASDVREQFNFYMQLNTVTPRQTTTEWWEFVSRFNGWNALFQQNFGRKIHLGYRDIILQSMNENKSGFQVENEPTPTTAAK